MFYMPNNLGTSYGQNWGALPLTPGARMAVNATKMAINNGSSEQVSSYIQKALQGAETTFAASVLAGGLNTLPGVSGFDTNNLLGLTQGVGVNTTIELFWSGHGGQRSANFRILMSPRSEAETQDCSRYCKSVQDFNAPIQVSRWRSTERWRKICAVSNGIPVEVYVWIYRARIYQQIQTHGSRKHEC